MPPKETIKIEGKTAGEIKRSISEKSIESDILDWLNQQKHCFAFKINTTGVYDPTQQVFRKLGKFTLKGTSDVLGIWRGKPLAIEVKKPGGKLTLEQKAFIDKYKKQDGVAFKADSLAQVIRNLEYYDRNGVVI